MMNDDAGDDGDDDRPPRADGDSRGVMVIPLLILICAVHNAQS